MAEWAESRDETWDGANSDRAEIENFTMTLASIIACSAPWRISIDALRQELHSLFGLRPEQLQPEIVSQQRVSPAGAVVLKLDDTPFAVTVHNVPLPIEHWIYGPQPNLYWPEAKLELAEHKAHLRVLVLSEPKNRQELVWITFGLLLLTAAVCRAANSIGVLWCPSDNLHSATHFVESEQQHFRDNTNALDLLIRLVIATGPDGIALATHGLSLFAGREIEFSPMKPSVLKLETMIERVFMVAGHLFLGATEKPGTLAPGDTIGPEGLIVRLDDQGMLVKGPIYRLLPPGTS